MSVADLVPDEPPPGLRYRRSSKFLPALAELWQRRELIVTLTARDFIARYKQTFLGVAWSVLQPLVLVVALTLFLRRIAHPNTHGVPYVLWSFVGLIPWSYFSGALSAGLSSLLQNQPLLNKVRCPREAFPFAAVLLATIDMAISVGTLGVVFAITTFAPRVTVYWIPVIFLVQLPALLGAATLSAIIVVYLRDLRSVLPLLLQLGLFVSPIAFNLSSVPSGYRLLYCFLNPVAPVIDSYRRVVLYGDAPQSGPLLAGALSGVVLFYVGMRIFKRLELGIADII